MCIVVDINALAVVFCEENLRHKDFAPVKKWIEDGRGFLVFGGTTYKKELKRAPRFMRLVRLLRDAGKAVCIRDKAVDEGEKSVLQKTRGTSCDDAHIIALLGVARCTLVCSCDARSFPFIRDRALYPKGMRKVKIYTSSKQRTLLKKMNPWSLSNLADPREE